jgi:hypothetical protein
LSRIRRDMRVSKLRIGVARGESNNSRKPLSVRVSDYPGRNVSEVRLRNTRLNYGVSGLMSQARDTELPAPEWMGGPTLLVGHSYGGTVITGAGRATT